MQVLATCSNLKVRVRHCSTLSPDFNAIRSAHSSAHRANCPILVSRLLNCQWNDRVLGRVRSSLPVNVNVMTMAVVVAPRHPVSTFLTLFTLRPLVDFIPFYSILFYSLYLSHRGGKSGYVRPAGPKSCYRDLEGSPKKLK
jgi:hypothetical protein